MQTQRPRSIDALTQDFFQYVVEQFTSPNECSYLN